MRRSRRATPYPLACYDAGLTADQRRMAAEISKLSVLDLPDDPLIGAIQRATTDSAPLKKPNKNSGLYGFARC